MNDNSPFGFGRFVPGFDFLQSLAKGAASGMPGLSGVPGMGALSGWVAPTANVQELDKRIQELKAVQFWLEQNARALSATVQALEVQKMTLATLAGMNVAVGDMAAAFGGAMGAAAPAGAASASAAPEKTAAEAAPAGAEAAQTGGAAMAMADPLQWWGALTSQFQQIAARAMQDAATQQAAFDATRDMASGALKTASDMAAQWTQAQAAPGDAPAKRAAKRAPAPAAAKAQAQAPKPAARKKA